MFSTLSCFCSLHSELFNLISAAFNNLFFWDSPFDTGDRVFIDEGNFVVKKMGLFAVGLPCYFGRAPFLTLA